MPLGSPYLHPELGCYLLPAKRFQQTVEAGLFTHAMCQSLSELFSCCVAVLVSAKGFWCAVALSVRHEPANRRLIVAAFCGRVGCGGCLVYGLWLSCHRPSRTFPHRPLRGLAGLSVPEKEKPDLRPLPLRGVGRTVPIHRQDANPVLLGCVIPTKGCTFIPQSYQLHNANSA